LQKNVTAFRGRFAEAKTGCISRIYHEPESQDG
jgi:hypothetical protein